MIAAESKSSDGFAPSTQGHAAAQLQTPSFRITDAHYRAGLSFRPHAHEYASITGVLNGGFVERYSRMNVECAAHSVLIKPAGVVHSNHYGESPTRCLLVAVTHPIGVLQRIFDRTIYLRDGVPYSLLLAVREETGVGDDVAPFAAEGLLLEFLAKVDRANWPNESHAPSWIQRLREELRARCLEQLRLTDVGEIAGVHPTYAARVFRRYYSCSPLEFVRRCRVDWGAAALIESSLPISQISVIVGFSDQSHFTRAFTRLTGHTPLSVRRSGARLTLEPLP